MKILFLHGWTSVPGGRKPTYLADHGHTVFNPALPDNDFDESVRIAQAEFDEHQPDVVVGSSRGGAVAMNIDSKDTPLVLICPAWKKWGSAKAVKKNTTILHSRADDVIPFADSEELLANSGLTANALIEIGSDHRLADPESLRMMVESCEKTFIKQTRLYVARLRHAIDEAKLKHPNQSDLPFVNHWPKNCCDAPYLFILLYERGHRGLVRKCGDVSHYGEGFEKHVWISVDGITIDISADQFPDVTDKVIVTCNSAWHDDLRIIREGPWASDGDGRLYERYLDSNSYYVYEKILPTYAPPWPSDGG